MKKQCLLLLLAVFGLMPVPRVTAQTFTTLHSFSKTFRLPVSNTNSDGAYPVANLLAVDNALYGTASAGGIAGNGTVFKVNTDGTGFTNLHIFTALSNYTNNDGAMPQGALIASGSTLYGTTSEGGNFANGTVFKMNTDGTGFTNLHYFTYCDYDADGNVTNGDGAIPISGLMLSDNMLYGTAEGGGSGGSGSLFALSTGGTGFRTLHSFLPAPQLFPQTNTDGAFPFGTLILAGNTLYGTAGRGGSLGQGTVFAINTNGSGFTNLYYLNGSSDGGRPLDGLLLSGNRLYGTAYNGGSHGDYGTVFALNTDGTGFTILHSFSENTFYGADSGGANPRASLIASGSTLYGTTYGLFGKGTVFAIKTDGTGFTNLYSFSGSSDGGFPVAGLILSGNTLYGATKSFGDFTTGTVFSLSLGTVISPLLTIKPSGTNVVLTWPTNATGFTLQSATNLVAPVVWNTNLPAPATVNGQNTVTNPSSGALKFYRLSL